MEEHEVPAQGKATSVMNWHLKETVYSIICHLGRLQLDPVFSSFSLHWPIDTA